MNKSRILVVDDNKIDVELFKGLLSNDYEVVAAYDGSEALIKVEENSSDLILLDIMMPGMSGYEVCKLLKDNEKNMYIPIIVVTALEEKEDKIKAIEAGADDFLNKPVDENILRIKMKSLLGVKRYYEELKFASKTKLVTINEPPEVEVEHPILYINTDRPDIVKSHLEIIILSLLFEKPMCGYDLIKRIFEKYNVLLSQGTVYPFLYSMKEEGILHAEFMKGNMRTKRYSPTQEGKQIIKRRLDEFIEAEEYILNSLKKLYV